MATPFIIHRCARPRGAAAVAVLICWLSAISGAQTISLDGAWKLAVDPQNIGRTNQWFNKPPDAARGAQVPGIIQMPYPAYHGVAWYWRDFDVPPVATKEQRFLLRFWGADYAGEVWVNGQPIGSHEGGETPFTLDASKAVKPGGANQVVVRILNPTDEPIDGITLAQTPHRNKMMHYVVGNSYNHGGLTDSVELLIAPAVRVADLFAVADPKSDTIHVRTTLDSAATEDRDLVAECSAGPALSGETMVRESLPIKARRRESVAQFDLKIPGARRWDVDDPHLYRVTVRIEPAGAMQSNPAADVQEVSTRVGFRDFRFEDGYFRLNGKRLFMRCSHTGNQVPVGQQQVPLKRDLLRTDLLYVKSMGFNTIRFIAGVATRDQLDLCDELGLMVYEEHYGSWLMGDSPKMAERFDRSVREMVLRDRNHASIVAWGLLNETVDGAVFRHAVQALPVVRGADDSRLVFLNSGRFDNQTGGPPAQADPAASKLQIWHGEAGPDPNVTHNPLAEPLALTGGTWPAGGLAMHPGPGGEYSDIRFTAAAAGTIAVDATFTDRAKLPATTDVHVLHNGKALFDGGINIGGAKGEAHFDSKAEVAAGDTIDFAVGWGNKQHGSDTTGVTLRITPGGAKLIDAANDFSDVQNPSGGWAYGMLAPGDRPDSKTFKPFAASGLNAGGAPAGAIGSLANPGASAWADVLTDIHPYRHFPHRVADVDFFRSCTDRHPIWISEYGVGSAVDLMRVVGRFEETGYPQAEDAQFYRRQRDQFLKDWQRYEMAETFGTPEEYFRQALAAMAHRRLVGLNAIRANPNIVGYSLSGTVDQGMSGEGLFTTFREFKPGTVDAVADGLAPLRWCVFAEPTNLYRGGRVKLDVSLADDDVMLPGEYTARLRVVGPGGKTFVEKTAPWKIQTPAAGEAPRPLVKSVFSEQALIDGPAGAYRVELTFDAGAAPAGGVSRFFVDDVALMPAVKSDVALWGEDPSVSKFLAGRAISTHPFDAGANRREVILISRAPKAPGDASAFTELVRHVSAGSVAIFLAPEVFSRNGDPLGWLPLQNRGRIESRAGWLYLKDDWARNHPIFDGLPAGGLLDETFYRDLIPDRFYAGQDPPEQTIAGGIWASADYVSGTTLAIYPLGSGKIALNTLLILDNLGTNPPAERLLRNMVNWAAGQAVGEPVPPKKFADQLKAIGYPEK